jgi:hypothetical protein
MTAKSRRLAGILLGILLTVLYGEVTILNFLIHDPAYKKTHYVKIYSGEDMLMPASYWFYRLPP